MLYEVKKILNILIYFFYVFNLSIFTFNEIEIKKIMFSESNYMFFIFN